MAIVVFNGKSYECARAVKGVDYVKLYDENNAVIIAFSGISDFSAFTLTEGEWETGVSTQTVAAYAELVNGIIQLTLLRPISVETGLTITFQAPCDCTESNGVSILGTNYTLVDAAGVALEAEFKAFAQNAMVRVILHTDENKAYIQNGAATTIEAGGTGANNAADAAKNLKILLPKTKTVLGLPETATPDDAFKGLFDKLAFQNMDKLVIQKIKMSGTWTVPKALNQTFKVFVVGGGGGGGNGGGGGGHIVIRDDVILNEGDEIDVVCGAGGDGAKNLGLDTVKAATDGGTTSFGSISANGGGAGGLDGTTRGHGGDGGAGGGGAGAVNVNSQSLPTASRGGNGGDASFGGGGGGGYSLQYKYSGTAQIVIAEEYCGSGGSAGSHGGKGGSNGEILDPKCVRSNISFIDILLNADNLVQPDISSTPSKRLGGGSMYGGNGGASNSGIGTTLAESGSGGGGGGFASNGGYACSGGGGGGGFCGRGGNGAYGGVYYNKYYSFGGGGGGGFFCKGGDACSYSDDNYTVSPGGGGGGFFDDGGSLTTSGDYPGTSGGKGGNGGVLIMYIKED